MACTDGRPCKSCCCSGVRVSEAQLVGSGRLAQPQPPRSSAWVHPHSRMDLFMPLRRSNGPAGCAQIFPSLPSAAGLPLSSSRPVSLVPCPRLLRRQVRRRYPPPKLVFVAPTRRTLMGCKRPFSVQKYRRPARRSRLVKGGRAWATAGCSPQAASECAPAFCISFLGNFWFLPLFQCACRKVEGRHARPYQSGSTKCYAFLQKA